MMNEAKSPGRSRQLERQDEAQSFVVPQNVSKRQSHSVKVVSLMTGWGADMYLSKIDKLSASRVTM